MSGAPIITALIITRSHPRVTQKGLNIATVVPHAVAPGDTASVLHAVLTAAASRQTKSLAILASVARWRLMSKAGRHAREAGRHAHKAGACWGRGSMRKKKSRKHILIGVSQSFQISWFHGQFDTMRRGDCHLLLLS